MNYDQLLQNTICEYKSSPVDILEIGDEEGEYKYLQSMTDSYVRTVRDIDLLFKPDKKKQILEIGSFLGAVSISFKKLGYNIFALDIPEFYQSKSLRDLYEKHAIPFEGVNLRNYKLPYEDDFFDAIILCEVLEHLNFNPLPVLQEINRVLKKGGYLYIGMPNQTHIVKRIKLLFGKSINEPIQSYFAQLDKNENMVAGLHWREYTLGETIEMIEKMNFEVVKGYYFSEKEIKLISIKSILKRLFYLVPSFKPFQVVIGQKKNDTSYHFWLTDK